jgi:hypothetical protein
MRKRWQDCELNLLRRQLLSGDPGNAEVLPEELSDTKARYGCNPYDALEETDLTGQALDPEPKLARLLLLGECPERNSLLP